MEKIAGGAFALFIAVIVITGGFAAASYEYDGTAEVDRTNNETVTVDYGNSTIVGPDDATGYYDNETVKNSSGGNLSDGDDYVFETDEGKITWVNTSDTYDGENATIEYTYTEKAPEVNTLMGVIRSGATFAALSLLIILALVVAGGMVAFMKQLGGSTMGR